MIAFASVLLAVTAGAGVYVWQQTELKSATDRNLALQKQLQQATDLASKQPNYSYKSVKGVDITVFTPLAKAKVTSPLNVLGMVPGNWSFEAQFLVQLKDSTGKVIAQSPATLSGDWMTTAAVPFTTRLEYSGQPTGQGQLVLIKSNASGLPEHDDSLTIPIQF